MSGFLVDSNVILDVATGDPQWSPWSTAQLASCADEGLLIINPLIYAEVSIGFEHVEEVEVTLSGDFWLRGPLPWRAAFLAGKCFLDYRRRGGSRRSPLPDFYIGAHAAVKGLTLLTRDAARYRTYFPNLEILAP